MLLCTCPPDRAEALASDLVKRRLAACVNVISGVASIYRWEGKVEREEEALLVIKTSSERIDALMRALPDLHPYDTPELLALPVGAGLSSYVEWVRASTNDESVS